MTGRRPRSIWCSPGERDAIAARAAAAGMTVSRFVMERAPAEGGTGERAAALTEAERDELHDGVRRLIGFVRLLEEAVGNDDMPEAAEGGE